jgi:serine/threonine protein kinase
MLVPRSNLLDEFYREVRVLANLRHPNIVLLMGACSAQGDLCIVTEYMEGGNLGEYIDKCRDSAGPGKMCVIVIL